jgi:UDP-N-acetylglucosamine 1-carboxyvinyltransferase
MEIIVVKGGNPLKGNIEVYGSKNAALPIMAASLLTNKSVEITNMPHLSDVLTMKRVMEHLGAKISTNGKLIQIDCSDVNHSKIPYDDVRTMRASVLLMAPLLARFKKVEISLPGGCAIGARPINLHLKALSALGANISLQNGNIIAEAIELRGAKIYFDISTVTGTENAMMAACFAKGQTRLENCAKEPEVVALADALVNMGAIINGAGTEIITVKGVSDLTGTRIELPPDRIVAGTYMIAAAVTGGDITVHNCEPEHLDAVLAHLRCTGCVIDIVKKSIRVRGPEQVISDDVKTLPYPGFPTDLQAQFMALMSIARGSSVITETIFENRFMHVAELRRMGANIAVEGHNAVIKGVKKLKGAPVMATDLRASVSLILAGLVADGETHINRIYHIDRGYQQIDEALRGLGAEIYRKKEMYEKDANHELPQIQIPIKKAPPSAWVSDRWHIPQEIRTPFRQYLIYFEDYLHVCKGINVNFNVNSVSDGIVIEVFVEDPKNVTEIAKHFHEYVKFIEHDSDKVRVTFTSDEASVKKDIFIIGLKNEIQQLKIKLEMRELENKYISNILRSERRMIKRFHMVAPTVNINLHQDISQTTAVTLNIYELYKQELPQLQKDLFKIKNRMQNDRDDIKNRINDIVKQISAVKPDISDKKDIPKNKYGKLRKFLIDASDKNSDLGKSINTLKDGLKLIQSISKRYNKIAQWFGLPQVPDVFL